MRIQPETLPPPPRWLTENPFCPDCGFRTYPRWGTHVCARDDVQRDRRRADHWAGHLLGYLDFYRVPPDQQLGALVIAMGYAFGRLVHPDQNLAKFQGMVAEIEAIITRESGLNPAHMVQNISARSQGRLLVRRPVAAPPRRRLVRPKGNHGP